MAVCNWKTECAWCQSTMEKGDELFFIDGEKVCGYCAYDHGYVCPGCDGQKKSQYERCYSCKKGENE